MQLISRRDTESLEGVRVRTAIPQAIHRHRRSRVVERILLLALLALGLSSLPQALWTVRAHADEISDLMNSPSGQSENPDQAENPDLKLKSGPDPCLDGLHTPH